MRPGYLAGLVDAVTEMYARHDTFSPHRMLPEDRRDALHRGIGEVIDVRGGVLDMRLLTGLILARRAG